MKIEEKKSLFFVFTSYELIEKKKTVLKSTMTTKEVENEREPLKYYFNQLTLYMLQVVTQPSHSHSNRSEASCKFLECCYQL